MNTSTPTSAALNIASFTRRFGLALVLALAGTLPTACDVQSDDDADFDVGDDPNADAGQVDPLAARGEAKKAEASDPRQQYTGPRTVLVELNAQPIHKAAEKLRAQFRVTLDDQSIRSFKKREFKLLSDGFIASAKKLGIPVVRAFENFPLVAVHVENSEYLASLERQFGIVAVHENMTFVPSLDQSLPQIGASVATRRGATGRRTAVAVLDTGVDFTRPAFGSCTSPGQPSTCRVGFAAEFASPDAALDDDGHGTNVAGIVLGTAPETNIIALDVFEQTPAGPVTNVVGLLAAIDFVVDTKFKFNTVAMNLSLGTDVLSSRSSCLSPVDAAFAEAQAVGIMPIVASGNDGRPNRISVPACSPFAVSVGAVDERDRVTDFSNSARSLDLLAPGTSIEAGGITMSGTSQATPHVAGAFAVMRSARSDLNQFQVLRALKDTGVAIRDPRQGRVTPRIQLDRALNWTAQIVPPTPLVNLLDVTLIEWDWAQCQVEQVVDGFECGWKTVVEQVTSELACGLVEVTSAAVCGAVQVTNAAICGTVNVVNAAVCGVEQIVVNPLDVVSGMTCSCSNWSCTCSVPLECDVPATCNVANTCSVPNTCAVQRACDPNVEACDPLSCQIDICEF